MGGRQRTTIFMGIGKESKEEEKTSSKSKKGKKK